jgi:hypothetical protein
MKCVLCSKDIAPGTPTVEFIGGLFDPEDPEFFVVDESVLSATHTHRDCMVEMVKKTKE